ncbi:MAG: hypothetical protein FWF80_05840, partial [Defluviitaleaceae bacterium]|nr:hypothetical protein [Defluviitaleaceae bacterium]
MRNVILKKALAILLALILLLGVAPVLGAEDYLNGYENGYENGESSNDDENGDENAAEDGGENGGESDYTNETGEAEEIPSGDPESEDPEEADEIDPGDSEPEDPEETDDIEADDLELLLPFDATDDARVVITTGGMTGAPQYMSIEDVQALLHNPAAQNMEITVTLLRDVTLPGALLGGAAPILPVDNNNSLTINSDMENGGPFTMTRQSDHIVLQTQTGAVYLQNVIIDGGGGSGKASLVRVAGGAFTMRSGATLLNSNTLAPGGGVFVSGGTFTMYGGEISNNTAVRGGGVFVDNGTFIMHGGTITGNSVFDNPAGVGVRVVGANGRFIMHGGEIFGNVGITADADDALIDNLSTDRWHGGRIGDV